MLMQLDRKTVVKALVAAVMIIHAKVHSCVQKILDQLMPLLQISSSLPGPIQPKSWRAPKQLEPWRHWLSFDLQLHSCTTEWSHLPSHPPEPGAKQK